MKPAPVLTFDEVAEEFLEWRRAEKGSAYNSEVAIRDARTMFDGEPLSAVTTAALERLRTSIVKRVVAKRVAKKGDDVTDEDRKAFTASGRATCNRRMSELRRMFNRLEEHERIDPGANPFKKGKLKPYSEAANARTRYYNVAEIDRLLAAATEPFRSYLALALNTGMRRSELLSAKVDRCDDAARTVTIRFTKGGKPHHAVLNTVAYEIVARLRKAACGPYLFQDDEGKRLTVNWARQQWERTRDRAGLQDARLHDCRHTFASHLVNGGVSLVKVQRLLNHSSSRLTERYCHLADDGLQAATEVMADVFAKLPKSARGLQGGLQTQAALPPVGARPRNNLGAAGFEPATSTVSR